MQVVRNGPHTIFAILRTPLAAHPLRLFTPAPILPILPPSHSCPPLATHPNPPCSVEAVDERRGTPHVFVVTVAQVEAGEELLLDYGRDFLRHIRCAAPLAGWLAGWVGGGAAGRRWRTACPQTRGRV